MAGSRARRACRRSTAARSARRRACYAKAISPNERAAASPTCARLHVAPVPESYADAAFVCARVERALASRPVLALAAHELSAVASALSDAANDSALWAPGALESVARALNEERSKETT